jgi:hypothetical protein
VLEEVGADTARHFVSIKQSNGSSHIFRSLPKFCRPPKQRLMYVDKHQQRNVYTLAKVMKNPRADISKRLKQAFSPNSFHHNQIIYTLFAFFVF